MRAMLTAIVCIAALSWPATVQAYEVHISITGAGQVTESTSANLLGTGCVTSASNPTGAVGIDCYPGDPSGDYAWGWTVRYVATPKTGYRFVHWQSDGSPKPVVCDGASNGSSTYTGSACQFATYDNLQTRAVFEDVTSPAMASLAGPNGPVNGATAFTFSATADPTLSGFECRVANVHEWTPCTTGRTENPASSGDYTFEVRAVDTSGNRSTASTWGWTVDKLAPETSYGSGPSGTVRSTSATFEFGSNEQGTFQCNRDNAGYSACSSPKTYDSLAQGNHTFSVRAVDAAGNVDASPVTREWSVDTVAPDTALTGGPAEGSTTTATSASFGLSSEAGALFRCQLDGGPIADCTDPESVSGLSLGTHTLKAWARDAAGNEDASPAVRTWTVAAAPDTAAPETSISSGPAQDSTTESTSATFEFGSTEPGTFECSLDGAAFSACSSPAALSGLAVGAHTFRVRARDGSGNVDATPAARAWTVRVPAGTGGGGTGSGTGTGGGTGTGTGGGTAPPPATPFDPPIAHGFDFVRGRAVFYKLAIRGLPAGSKLLVACKGGGCPVKRRAIKVKRSKVDVLKAVKAIKLRPGAVLTVTATSPTGQRKVGTWRIAKRTKVTYRCAAAGAKLGRC